MRGRHVGQVPGQRDGGRDRGLARASGRGPACVSSRTERARGSAAGIRSASSWARSENLYPPSRTPSTNGSGSASSGSAARAVAPASTCRASAAPARRRARGGALADPQQDQPDHAVRGAGRRPDDLARFAGQAVGRERLGHGGRRPGQGGRPGAGDRPRPAGPSAAVRRAPVVRPDRGSPLGARPRTDAIRAASPTAPGDVRTSSTAARYGVTSISTGNVRRRPSSGPRPVWPPRQRTVRPPAGHHPRGARA